MRGRKSLGVAVAVATFFGCAQIFNIADPNLVDETTEGGSSSHDDAGVREDGGGADASMPLDDGAVSANDSGDAGSVVDGGAGDAGVTVVDLSLGDGNTCIVLSNGTVLCWGDNANGQLGGDTTGAPSVTPTAVHGITTARNVALGSMHACALMNDLKVRCWGSDGAGQSGVTTPTNACSCLSGATDVGLGATTATRTGLGAGGFTTLAVRDGLKRWGSFTGGGGGAYSPTTVSTTDSIDEAHAGNNHACYRTGGTVKCWGLYDDFGQLGRGSITAVPSDRAIITPVVSISTAAQLSVGGDSACVVTTAGDVYCWGSNAFGKLGTSASAGPQCNGAGSTCASTPIQVMLGAPAKEVSVGDSTICARMNDGSVQCWGTNTYGECARAGGPVNVPPGAASLSDIARIVLGGRHGCALQTDRTTVRCWGRNNVSQLGYVTASGQSYVPTVVAY